MTESNQTTQTEDATASDLKALLGSRTQKYRAWDKQDQRLIVHEQDFIPLKVTSAGVFRLDPHIEENRWMLADPERFILTEYVGKKDINGDEIFEGDIVKWDGYLLMVKWNDEYSSFDLKYLDDNGYCKRDYFECGNSEAMEIVGNIFENPALVGE